MFPIILQQTTIKISLSVDFLEWWVTGTYLKIYMLALLDFIYEVCGGIQIWKSGNVERMSKNREVHSFMIVS